MLSKEEAESKILKLFYFFEREKFWKKNPESAEIYDFLETTDGTDHQDHGWDLSKDGKILYISMWARDYECGMYYVTRTFAMLNATIKPGMLTKVWGWVLFLIGVCFSVFGFWTFIVVTNEIYYIAQNILLISLSLGLFIATVFLIPILSRIRKIRIRKHFFENLAKIAEEIIPDAEKDSKYFSTSFRHGLGVFFMYFWATVMAIVAGGSFIFSHFFY